MKKMNKFVYNIILAILLVCTVIILYQVITNHLKRENHCLNPLNQAETMVFCIFIVEAYHLYVIFWLWHVKPSAILLQKHKHKITANHPYSLICSVILSFLRNLNTIPGISAPNARSTGHVISTGTSVNL